MSSVERKDTQTENNLIPYILRIHSSIKTIQLLLISYLPEVNPQPTQKALTDLIDKVGKEVAKIEVELYNLSKAIEVKLLTPKRYGSGRQWRKTSK